MNRCSKGPKSRFMCGSWGCLRNSSMVVKPSNHYHELAQGRTLKLWGGHRPLLRTTNQTGGRDGNPGQTLTVNIPPSLDFVFQKISQLGLLTIDIFSQKERGRVIAHLRFQQLFQTSLCNSTLTAHGLCGFGEEWCCSHRRPASMATCPQFKSNRRLYTFAW